MESANRIACRVLVMARLLNRARRRTSAALGLVLYPAFPSEGARGERRDRRPAPHFGNRKRSRKDDTLATGEGDHGLRAADCGPAGLRAPGSGLRATGHRLPATSQRPPASPCGVCGLLSRIGKYGFFLERGERRLATRAGPTTYDRTSTSSRFDPGALGALGQRSCSERCRGALLHVVRRAPSDGAS